MTDDTVLCTIDSRGVASVTPEFHDRIVDEAALRRRTPKAAEGFASFREKRRPRWYPEK